MNISNFYPFLKAICVKIHLFKISELRDQKIILALSFIVYVSSGLSAYAMYINVDFLLRSSFIAFLIAICTFAFFVLHHQSLMATDAKNQIYATLLISFVLACSFTLTNNAKKDYDTLASELTQITSLQNSQVTADMNAEIDAINKEEMVIMRRIEVAGERINQTKQPLIDARRSLKAFKENKALRIAMIRDKYKDKYVQPKISDISIVVLQAKKFISGGEGTLIAIILLFLFFILEALPQILRIMVDDGDYFSRYLASLFVVRDLRDQRIAQQQNFASADSDIIANLLHLEIIDKKSELINNGFQDTEEMILLDQKQKILNAGYNPYTGQPLDYVNLDFIRDKFNPTQEEQSDNKETSNQHSSTNNQTKQEEPVFAL